MKAYSLIILILISIATIISPSCEDTEENIEPISIDSVDVTNPNDTTTNPADTVKPSETPCQDGIAGTYPCHGMTLMSHIPVKELGDGAEKTIVNDSWGWTDSESGIEYAIVGTSSGTAFVSLEDPVNPVIIGKLPTNSVSSDWRDIKVYKKYAFIVSEAKDHGMQVFDLTKLRNVDSPPAAFSSDAIYTEFGNAHNIIINEESGFAYVIGTETYEGGPHIVDINDPLNPVAAGGYAGGEYSHDAQVVD